jgi:hypothetical protein
MQRPLTPLCELAVKYQTDKGGRHFMYNGQPCEQCHEYTPVYWDIFKGKQNIVRRVLEIGVNSGASLRMWRDFFPNAEITGFDIDPGYLFREERIRCFRADAGHGGSLYDALQAAGHMLEKFDLIVDDGSHELDQQKCALNVLLPWLAPQGLYIVEDVIYPAGVIASIPTAMGFQGIIVDTDNNRGGVDHLVMIAHA